MSTTSGVPTEHLGSIGTTNDGRTFVRFERTLPHPVAVVWAAITEPDQLARWFPGLRLDRREGGQFEIWFGGACEGPAHVSGTVTRFEPPGFLEFGSQRYALEAAGEGCRLTFTDVVTFEPGRNDADLINSVLGGWHKYLDTLAIALGVGSVDPRDEPEFDYARVDVRGRA